MRKNRESYCSLEPQKFFDPTTGIYQRLDNTAWYLKNRNGKVGYFLNMHTKFQQMPDACFKATAERTAELNVPAIQSQIKDFMEVTNESN
jgi:hypothetical protein|tara:strand:+ start:302 stop:571 length:270 start_codon:yes stop_codon:yes gene_type:complete